MIAVDRIIRWSTASAVVGVAAVAAIVFCEHANALVRAHGGAGQTARLVPLMVNGLFFASWNGHARLGAPEAPVASPLARSFLV